MFNLAYYGAGGFPIDVLYDLPVLQRKFYLKLLNNAKKEELESLNKNNSTPGNKPPPTPDRYNNIKSQNS